MKKLNKKAIAIPSVVVFIIMVIIFAFIAAVSFLLLSLDGCTTQSQQEFTINQAKETLDSNNILTNLIKTPVNIEGEDLTFAELGILALDDITYDGRIENQLLIFQQFPHSYVIEISKQGQIPRRFGNPDLISYMRLAEFLVSNPPQALVELPSPEGIVEFKLYRKMPS